VHLNFRVRYVQPSSPVRSDKLAIANGDAQTGPNGIATPEPEANPETAGDFKEKVDEIKEKVLGVAEKINDMVDTTDGDKDKVWEKNGYAHAPFWPQVSCIPASSETLTVSFGNHTSRSSWATPNSTR
jgi:hypothetical protein